jgi:hypothetical protein
MKKYILLLLLMGLLISGCGVLTPATSVPVITPTIVITDTSTPRPPTPTPTPTKTVTPTPTPDLKTIGLPSEPDGTLAFDFVDQICAAEWYTPEQSLPCPGDANQTDMGYVMRLEEGVEGMPAGIPMMLTYPPLVHYSKIFSKYPAFTVQKGDRFRTVTGCVAHKFCDVEFYLNFFNQNGERYLKRWQYRFTDPPIVIDYSLDSLAGETVQFDLAVVAKAPIPEMYAVWIAPHIYRPIP